jgi:ankyrin repeat protein
LTGQSFGAKISLLSSLSFSPLSLSPLLSQSLEATMAHLLTIILTLLSLHPTSADQQPTLNTRLFEAAASQDVTAAREALKAGADINSKEERGGQTPLMQSVLFGRDEMVKFFLEEGADVYVFVCCVVCCCCCCWHTYDLTLDFCIFLVLCSTIGERDGYTPMVRSYTPTECIDCLVRLYYAQQIT